jgi:hypothetical protein
MGSDPATSVTDPCGRVWGDPNLRVIDGSLHVTNGGGESVTDDLRQSFRIMHTWVGSGRNYLSLASNYPGRQPLGASDPTPNIRVES